MTPEKARELLEEIRKRKIRKINGSRYHELLLRRAEFQQAFEDIIGKMGLKHLFVDHEITRKQDGKWIWRNMKKGKKTAPQASDDEEGGEFNFYPYDF